MAETIAQIVEREWMVKKMRPMLSIKIIDSDTNIELDKVDKLIAPTESNYEFIGEIMYRIYK